MLMWDDALSSMNSGNGFFEGLPDEIGSTVRLSVAGKSFLCEVPDVSGILMRELNAYGNKKLKRDVSRLQMALNTRNIELQICMSYRLGISVHVHDNKDMYL